MGKIALSEENIMWNPNSRQRSFPRLILVLCAVGTIISCPCLPGNGSLKIRAYGESWASDPSLITEDVKINAILDVTYPDGTKHTIVTDSLGYYDFGSVVAGDYLVQPRYLASSAAKTFTVMEGETTGGDLVIPGIGIYYYVLNPAKPQVSSLDVRRALCEAIIRENIRGSVSGSTGLPENNLIPISMEGSWSSFASSLIESIDGANGHLADAGAIVLEILYNTSTTHAAIANTIKSEWEILVGSGASSVSVTLNSKEWATYLDMVINRDYVVARSGWIIDSNNLLSLFGAPNIPADSGYTEILNETTVALTNLDFDAYEAGLVALNNYLIESAIVLPIYNYYP